MKKIAKATVENVICGMTDWTERFHLTRFVGRPLSILWFKAHHNRLYWWAVD